MPHEPLPRESQLREHASDIREIKQDATGCTWMSERKRVPGNVRSFKLQAHQGRHNRAGPYQRCFQRSRSTIAFPRFGEGSRESHERGAAEQCALEVHGSSRSE